MVRAQLRAEENAVQREELAERETPWWRFKIQCHCFVAFPWKPGGILGETSSLKIPTHYYMLTEKLEAVWRRLGILL